jgi:hypothetical protein
VATQSLWLGHEIETNCCDVMSARSLTAPIVQLDAASATMAWVIPPESVEEPTAQQCVVS